MARAHPPLDSLQEVKVSTNNADATMGTYGGAHVNAFLKSGTNSFHGSAYEFYRGEALNAYNWRATSKAPYQSNQFGGSLGGPILRQKAFFFLDYQGPQLQNGKSYILTVPTDLMKHGLFLQHLGAAVAVDRKRLTRVQDRDCANAWNFGVEHQLTKTSALDVALYFDAIADPAHVQRALNYVADPAYWKKINVEEESYLPQVLFHYGRWEAAYPVLFDLSSSTKQRREYPDVSFAVVAAIVSGATGIEPSQAGDAFDVRTLAQPSRDAEALSLASLQIRGHLVNVSHTGTTSTRLVNRQGPAIRWKAAFLGDVEFLHANGHAQHALRGVLPGGSLVSWITVPVPPNASMSVGRDEETDAVHG